MSFNWDKFYDVGSCMKNISEKEEYQRSAVGRFYYAAFGLVKNYFEDKYHIMVPSNDSHSFLINELEKSYGDEKTLGENLRKIRRFRNFADYNNKFILNNFITSNEEVMKLCDNHIIVETDYEISPFIGTLGEMFPDLVAIDVNNYKIARIGLVSS